MSETACLTIDGKVHKYPVITGTEGEKGIDIRSLRSDSGYITYDDGYANTGSCMSRITFIDGETGILRHRGYAIEELAAGSDFIEVAYLIIYGELPNRDQIASFRNLILGNAAIHQSMFHSFAGFPASSHPMAILSAMLNSLGCYYPHMATNNREQDLEHLDDAATILISKVRALAAMAYRMKLGRPFIYPRGQLSYCSNLLHMMFSEPYADYTASSRVDRALNLVLLLHADHEQNCSTSTVRMVASGGANLFASVSAGVCALWGPAHGGANMAVIEMLESIHKEGDDGTRFVEAAKSGDRSKRLMGFGHRVYKHYDPRAQILKEASKKVFASMRLQDPVLDIALKLEEIASHDEYFITRKLYPNVDFYSGIIMRSIGIPIDFFTVLFAIGRMPGWIANWKEIATGKSSIHRPRQIYTGSTLRKFVPLEERL
ncbi:MAG: citrate synthase [Verrucomicrobia bacterium]|jgi:citrate synthase|nr:citrate synthase [Verrucomicrobiota bacterium]MBV8639905.1 citrate synthase [Verrucomicrobiota bacterium]